MKIERFLFGMFNGRISLLKTSGLCNIITDQNFQYLRELEVEPENGYLWLPTEQVIAFPRIITVYDRDGREFIQNETLLIPIHDYIKLTKQAIQLKQCSLEREYLPEVLEPLEVTL